MSDKQIKQNIERLIVTETNKTKFILSETPVGDIKVTLNGLTINENEFIIDGKELTILFEAFTYDIIQVFYVYEYVSNDVDETIIYDFSKKSFQ